MKIILFVSIFIVILAGSVLAEQTISEYLANADEYVYVVLGENSQGSDTFAAADLVFGIMDHNDINITYVLEGEISNNLPMIFISPPCGSLAEEFLGYPCEEWPYEDGYAMVKVQDESLLIIGSTQDDRKRAGIILKDYPDYSELENYSFVFVNGTGFNLDEISITPGKKTFVCGDGICDIGETFLCFPDCSKKSCSDICGDEGYDESFCRDIPSNPNVPICLDDEKNKGMQYCTAQKSCCCGMAEVIEPEQELPVAKVEEEKQEKNPAKTIVVFAITAILIILLIGYIASR
ncbi:MAG: hypothetical protein Q8Q42_03655 [Nanoarchaeota archaeon]|nr:hypothetical protein [Nanoarchaeota archaeon]